MKKIVALASLLIVLTSCSKVKKGEFLITGTAKGIENGKSVILQKQNDNGMGVIALDTVKVKDGKFEFKGKIEEPAIYSILLPEYNGGFPVIVENDEIKVEVNKDTISNSKISGTYNNDEFQHFRKTTMGIQKKMMAFQQKNMQVYNDAQQKKDTVTINKLMKENNVFQKELKNYFEKYADNHPKAFISLLILGESFRSPDFNLEKTKKTFNSMDESLKSSKMGKKIKDQIDQMEKLLKTPKTVTPPTIGLVAPDFTAKTPQGVDISLKQAMGKVTLIDFWASWCGPCRKENPNVVAIYKEFHTKGLNIVGVSLDKDVNKWNEAIAKDNITWTQISHLKEWNEPIAKQYGVEQIPTTFLLDASGKIVAKDLRGDELKAKIAELLK
jgi:thiol-disulfide isomerase/thioredoxin